MKKNLAGSGKMLVNISHVCYMDYMLKKNREIKVLPTKFFSLTCPTNDLKQWRLFTFHNFSWESVEAETTVSLFKNLT